MGASGWQRSQTEGAGNLGATVCGWHLRWGQSRGAEPLTCVIGGYLQVGGVRIELNCMTPYWGHRELLGRGNPTHLG